MAGRITQRASVLLATVLGAIALVPRAAHAQLPRDQRGFACCARTVAGVARVPQFAAAWVPPESLRVLRPMSGAERGVVGLAATLSGVSWGLGGAAAAGATGLLACVARSGEATLDRVRECRTAERWLVAGGVIGTLVGAASGAGFAARRLGCGAGESRTRAWRGAALGTLVAALPAAAYAGAEDPSLLVGAAVVVVVPTLQIAAAARDAGRCRLPVPILR